MTAKGESYGTYHLDATSFPVPYEQLALVFVATDEHDTEILARNLDSERIISSMGLMDDGSRIGCVGMPLARRQL